MTRTPAGAAAARVGRGLAVTGVLLAMLPAAPAHAGQPPDIVAVELSWLAPLAPCVAAFDSASIDPDGTTIRDAWVFGDAATSSVASPYHAYAPGTYTAT